MWNELIDASITAYGLTEEEKQCMSASISTIRKTLGENFLDEAMKINPPVFNLFMAKSDFSYRWLIWFAKELTNLKGHKRYSLVISHLLNLKNKAEFYATLPVLEASVTLSKYGYEIIHIPTNKGKPTSDFAVIDPSTNKRLNVEVTKKDEPPDIVKSRELYLKLVEILHERVGDNFHYGGQIYRLLDGALTKLNRQLVNVINGRITEINVRGIMHLAFSRKHSGITLPDFAKEGLHYYPYTDGALVRELIRTLKYKKRQSPAIIILQSHLIPTYLVNEMSVVDKVDKWIKGHSDILGIVVVNPDGSVPLNGRYGYNGIIKRISANCTFAGRLLPSRSARRYLIFSNPDCKINKAKILYENLRDAYLHPE